MDLIQLGNELKAYIESGNPHGAFENLYHPDVVSIEAGGSAESTTTGIAACLQKAEWFGNEFEVHGGTVTGPFPDGVDQVAILMSYDVTQKSSGHRFPLEEIGVYTFADGKIVKEKFYNTMPSG